MGKGVIFMEDGYLCLDNLSETQKEFIKCDKLYTGVVGGYQSGKSEALAVKTIVNLLRAPNVPRAYYLPTYGLIEDMLVPKFERLLGENLKIDFTHKKKESKIVCAYGEIWMRSMDNPDSIVGYSVGGASVDEVDVVHKKKVKEAMKRISSRNSYKTIIPSTTDYVSTPEGYGFMYEFFKERANDNKKLFVLDTLKNKGNLAEGYVEGLIEQYGHDPNLLKAYLHGEFVNLKSGNVYNKYERNKNNTHRRVLSDDTLHIGMDFNITKMSAVVHVIDDGIKKAVQEFTDVYDTPAMINEIRKMFPHHPVVVYPDASGKNRKTSGKSDTQLLKDAGFTINTRNRNPLVRDRVTEANKAFENAYGIVTYKVNISTCPKYTQALEQLGYDTNGEPDKASGLDHVTDAGTYFNYQYGKKGVRMKVTKR